MFVVLSRIKLIEGRKISQETLKLSLLLSANERGSILTVAQGLETG